MAHFNIPETIAKFRNHTVQNLDLRRIMRDIGDHIHDVILCNDHHSIKPFPHHFIHNDYISHIPFTTYCGDFKFRVLYSGNDNVSVKCWLNRKSCSEEVARLTSSNEWHVTHLSEGLSEMVSRAGIRNIEFLFTAPTGDEFITTFNHLGSNIRRLNLLDVANISSCSAFEPMTDKWDEDRYTKDFSLSQLVLMRAVKEYDSNPELAIQTYGNIFK